MNVLILCAGRGRRLRPLTYFMPKPMVKIKGKPILEHILDYLDTFGTYQVYINIHYKPEKFMRYFGDRLLYFYEKELSGEEGAIEKLINLVPSIKNDYLIVMNGDTLTNLNLAEMYKMSKGKSIRAMHEKVYTGIKILSPDYLQGIDKEIYEYRSGHLWTDYGTWKRLLFGKSKKEYDRYKDK